MVEVVEEAAQLDKRRSDLDLGDDQHVRRNSYSPLHPCNVSRILDTGRWQRRVRASWQSRLFRFQSAAMTGLPFQDLNRMIGGLKRIIEKCHPTIVMTGPFNSRSGPVPRAAKFLPISGEF